MGTPSRLHRRSAGPPGSTVEPRHLVVVGVVLSLTLGPVTATAAATIAPASKGKATEAAPAEPEVDPQVQQAMEAYRRGTENYNLAQYDAALADFKEASSLYASADFQYNIGLCYEKLGKYDEAIQAFVTYLKAKPDAEDRANVENLIAELRDKIEQQEREAERAEAERAEAERKAREEELARQQQPSTEPTDDRSDGRGLVLSGAALIGVGAAVAVGGGIAFGVLARQRSLAITDAQFEGNPDRLTFAEAQAIEDEGKRFEAIQIGMAAGGAVVAVTGAVLLAVGLRKRQAVQASAWLGPRSTAGLVFTGRF